MMESVRNKEREEEDLRIQILVNTPALPSSTTSRSRGGGGMVWRRGQDGGGFKSKIPPAGYVCRRCKVGSHFIQHCPTNGDPNYDMKTVKPPTGIPKSMLVADPGGFYVTPSGQACLQPNDADFEKQVDAFPSKRPAFDFPPELHCPLCKKVMKDAVMASKCCFTSFCDKCIRDRLITSRLQCHCGAEDMLAYYLIPNMTVRRTINRILESGSGSSGGGGRSLSFLFQDTGSSVNSSKPSSPVGLDDRTSGAKRAKSGESGDVPVEEPKRQSLKVGGDKEVVQQKQASGGEGKKKRTRKNPQNVEAESYMILGADSYGCNPYWNGVWTGHPYYAAGNMGYGFGQFGWQEAGMQGAQADH